MKLAGWCLVSATSGHPGRSLHEKAGEWWRCGSASTGERLYESGPENRVNFTSSWEDWPREFERWTGVLRRIEVRKAVTILSQPLWEKPPMVSSTMDRALDPQAMESRTQAIGRTLFERIGRGPSPWQPAWWDDHLMNLTLGDPKVKVQLFRLTDAMPALRTTESIRRHLVEYLNEAEDHVTLVHAAGGAPGSTWLASRWDRCGGRTVRGDPYGEAFIAGATPMEALRTVLKLRKERVGFTADLLGEAVISEAEAELYQQTCLELIRGLASPLASEPEIRQIDRDDRGPIPRVNLSLKLTSLTARFDAHALGGHGAGRAGATEADLADRARSQERTSTSIWSSTPTRI